MGDSPPFLPFRKNTVAAIRYFEGQANTLAKKS